MSRKYLLASIARLDDASPGGILATAMRSLANAAPSATGMTFITPEGVARYVSRAEAERYVNGPKKMEARQ